MTVEKQSGELWTRIQRAANPMEYSRDTIYRDIGESALFWGAVGAIAGLASGVWSDLKSPLKARRVKDTSVVDLPLGGVHEPESEEKEAGGGKLGRVIHDLTGVPPLVWAATVGISTLAAYGGKRAGKAVHDVVIPSPATRERHKIEDLFTEEYKRTRGKDSYNKEASTPGLRDVDNQMRTEGTGTEQGEERGVLGALGDWGSVLAVTSVLSFFAAGGILGYKRHAVQDPARRRMKLLRNIKDRHEADLTQPPRIELGPMAQFAETGSPSRRQAAVPEKVR